MRSPVRQEVLRRRLDQLAATFDLSTIEPDPLQLVLRYTEPRDQEVAGLIAAAFAYGRADIIVANAGGVLAKMEPSPFRYLQKFDADEGRKRFAGFSHRFHKTDDLVLLLTRIASVIESHGSLGELFRACYEPDDDDIGPSLTRFVGAIIGEVIGEGEPLTRPSATLSRRERALKPQSLLPPGEGARRADEGRAAPTLQVEGRVRRDAALHYLLSSPADGSACKRMNLYLRWMVRRTAPDLGLWTFVSPAKLVVPVDTHVHRIATFLGLNRRKSADWIAARAITDRLARFDSADPVRYDFSLCRLGILDLCSRKRRKENCDVCLLRDVCRFPVV